jgi:hypothetical protein
MDNMLVGEADALFVEESEAVCDSVDDLDVVTADVAEALRVLLGLDEDDLDTSTDELFELVREREVVNDRDWEVESVISIVFDGLLEMVWLDDQLAVESAVSVVVHVLVPEILLDWLESNVGETSVIDTV